jgi:hypothetical protein
MPASERKRRDVAARRAKALAMRAAGATFQQIADTVPGYRTAGAACQDITRALRARAAEQLAAGPDTWVTLELERLDTIDRAANVVMNRADAAGDPVLVLRAADRIMRISDRRTLLLGMAPGAAGRGQGGGGGPDGDQDDGDVIDELGAERTRRRGTAYG